MAGVARRVIDEKYDEIRAQVADGARLAEALQPRADAAGVKMHTLRCAFLKMARTRGDHAPSVPKEAKGKAKIEPPPSPQAAIEALEKLRAADVNIYGAFMRDGAFAAYVAKMIDAIGPRRAANMLAQIGIDVREATLRKTTENRALPAPSAGVAQMAPSALRAVKENKRSDGVLRSANEDV
jgi:hypothetical protein